MKRFFSKNSKSSQALLVVFILVFCVYLSSCRSTSRDEKVVVVYTSVDQPFSEPILAEFEHQTGIQVKAVYDVEAAKTTGLVNRLISEVGNPRADVFWNSEIIQTILLKENEVLAPYVSPQAEEIPSSYRDPNGFWTGMAARARVLIVNTNHVPQPEAVTSIYDLLDPNWDSDAVGIAYPIFGTTATHAAALYSFLGPQAGYDYFSDLASRGVRVVNGNSVVRDLTANGELVFGLTDTDDACGALAKGAPVAIILPDQDSIGTLIIPATVALIANAPNTEEGKTLIDYLLSIEVERALIEAGFSHIPLHANVKVPDSCLSFQDIRGMDVDYAHVYSYLETVQSELREIFVK